MKPRVVNRLTPRLHYDEMQEMPGMIGYLEPLAERDGDGNLSEDARPCLDEMIDKVSRRGAINSWSASRLVDAFGLWDEV